MLRMLTLLGRKNLPVIGKVEANSGDNQKPVNSLLAYYKGTMVPILASTIQNQFDEQSFKAHLIELCEEHHDNQRALSFAFIVYDFQNPSIRKLITDLHYWQALHDLSGSYLSIFYLAGCRTLGSDNSQCTDFRCFCVSAPP